MTIYNMRTLFLTLLIASISTSFAQEKVAPVIKNFGAIYEIPEATIKPDPSKDYKIIVDVFGGASDKKEIDRSLNNVARMINLHSVGGVPAEKMNIVLALHAQSTYSILNNKSFREQFGVDNPNAALIKELKEAGVKVAVCGQSLRGRGFDKDMILDEVEIATSMLTTVTHYQNLGYTLLKF